jgi:dolichol-phosphate mannosyltransferase
MMIYFLVPVYNEDENIPELTQELKRVMPDEQKYYVFVDDHSSDGSVENLKKHFDLQSMTILDKKENLGPGDSFNRGFEWIIQHSQDRDDIIVTIEADNTSDLAILPDMVALSRMGFDLVLASIYAQGGGFDKTTHVRKLLSFGANMIFRLIFNVKVLTLSSFYRVYRVTLIRDIKKNNRSIIEEKGFISMLEILLKAIDRQARVIEVPMVLQSLKRKGKSKMKTVQTMLSYLRFVVQHKLCPGMKGSQPWKA